MASWPIAADSSANAARRVGLVSLDPAVVFPSGARVRLGDDHPGRRQGRPLGRTELDPEVAVGDLAAAFVDHHIVDLTKRVALRVVDIGERARMPFIRHYAYGVVGVLFTHFLVNIGMTMGIMPVIGIPLPFISSGGSSLIGFGFLLGVLFSMDSSWMRSRRVA